MRATKQMKMSGVYEHRNFSTAISGNSSLQVKFKCHKMTMDSFCLDMNLFKYVEQTTCCQD